jgi:hypothetical protein
MKLLRNNYRLTEIFRSATVPDIAEFNGEYLVDMLTGPPSFSRFGHRKVFYKEDDKILGYNIIKKPWGHFSLEAGVSDVDDRGMVVINYDVKENLFIFRGIRDHVRCIEEKAVYIGRFNYTIMDKLHFLGYFLLLRTS